MANSLESWLQSILGNKLEEVFALTYVFDSEKDFVNPQALDIRFESSNKGVLRGSEDGESVAWYEEDVLESRDLGDHGAESVEQVSHLQVWATALGRKLQQFQIIISSQADRPVGISLEFENNAWVCVLNYGDELCVFDEIPKDILDAEGFTFQKGLAGGL